MIGSGVLSPFARPPTWWKDEGCELLTGTEETWLVGQQTDSRIAEFLAKMYNLPATTLDSYVHKVMRGKIHRRDHGKPPLVDEIVSLRYSIRE